MTWRGEANVEASAWGFGRIGPHEDAGLADVLDVGKQEVLLVAAVDLEVDEHARRKTPLARVRTRVIGSRAAGQETIATG